MNPDATIETRFSGARVPDSAIEGLARDLIRIVTEYYRDPEHEAAFLAWKAEREKGAS